ncbi:hypothetical protein [Azospirillum rugosum]|uniref:Uncharacterized protein n=1 Tax=Azospirillum rugosum TaxID=416170 RepID=A0ABS4SJ80_9PROT|nr:hypothetical protein [Azospirillum rugosum]MBP2292557.1 hypothetical protein [Azospirillum rugosum]MDQ0526419.1 hypothetical protein [Azospirillum rugosum]
MSVSKLGQALKGVAAEAFNQLSDKAKGFLENLVKSGAVSAKEVALGLRSAASEATFSRYVAERPQDEEDKQRLAAADAASERMRNYASDLGSARIAFSAARDKLRKQQAGGELSATEVQEKLAPLQEDFAKSVTALDKDYSPEQRQSDLSQGDTGGLAKNMNGFVAAISNNMGEDGLISPYSSEGKAAGEKLFKLGFREEVFGNAFKSFANGVDLPGIGRKVSTRSGSSAPSTNETSAASQQKSAATAKGKFPVTAPVDGAQVPSALDPGNAKTAMSILKAASGANAKSNTPATAVPAASEEANANLMALMDALKSGVSPSSPSVKIDT